MLVRLITRRGGEEDGLVSNLPLAYASMKMICNSRQALTVKAHGGVPKGNANGLKLLSVDREDCVGVMDSDGKEQMDKLQSACISARAAAFPTTDSPRLQALSQISVG